MKTISIFIFTRDLRLHDNTTLLKALKESKIVIPIFIFNPIQINNTNKYKSNNCVQFMCECLDELNLELEKNGSRLYFFYDSPENVISSLLKTNNDIKSVYINMDYSPFAKKRDNAIEKVCKKYNANFFSYEDYLLTGKDEVVNGSNEPYVKFTPFYKKAIKIKVGEPNNSNPKNYIDKKIKFNSEFIKNYHNFYEPNENIAVRGGRSLALKILKNITKYKKYNTERDYPNKNGTTQLSAYLKFNVVSIREVYDTLKKKLGIANKLITQLYWRDFYMIILNHHPHILQGKSLKPKYDNIKWSNNKKWFKMWCEGKMGIPIADAGMKQMNETGFMHNRCRMIVASILIKNMQIDWRFGEKYFATKLVDYDPANNNGGWTWCSGSGADSQPYFRVFSPARQTESFDKECEYIKKWIPELKDVPAKDIINWETAYKKYPKVKYPAPIINFAESREAGLKMYSAIAIEDCSVC
jgi:deoxyribodipyrimidine photo-lyase